MDFALIVLPIIAIIVICQLLHLRFVYTLVLVIVLGFISTEIVDYIYCSVLKPECEPEALKRAGMFFHSCIVIFFSLLANWGINELIKYWKGRHVS
ncbi:MAG: hypothetical protein Alis3KO_41320 [Aliiglaciecola sp.]